MKPRHIAILSAALATAGCGSDHNNSGLFPGGSYTPPAPTSTNDAGVPESGTGAGGNSGEAGVGGMDAGLPCDNPAEECKIDVNYGNGCRLEALPTSEGYMTLAGRKLHNQEPHTSKDYPITLGDFVLLEKDGHTTLMQYLLHDSQDLTFGNDCTSEMVVIPLYEGAGSLPAAGYFHGVNIGQGHYINVDLNGDGALTGAETKVEGNSLESLVECEKVCP